MELLVVVAIIALLAALLLPALKEARFRSLLAVCTSNMRQSYLGLQMYGNDFGGRYPLADEGGPWPAQPPGYWGAAYDVSGVPGLVQTLGYLANPRVVYCPGRYGLTKWGCPNHPDHNGDTEN